MISNTSFNGLRIFIATVELGNYSKAAEKLNLSKSAVSKAVSSLEERLGITLLQRTTRTLKLTDEGRIYYDSCVKALTELAQTEASLSQQKQTPAGVVRMNLPILFGKNWILPILLDLAESYPQIQFEIGFNNEPVNLIEDDVDLVVRIGQLPDSTNLSARLLGSQGITTCASSRYLQKFGTPENIEDLKHHQCIVEINRKGPTPWIFTSAAGKTSRITNIGRFNLEGSEACLQAALLHHGIVQIPSWLAADSIKSGKLIAVLEDQNAALPIHALWPRTAQKTNRKIRIIIDELLKRLSNMAF